MRGTFPSQAIARLIEEECIVAEHEFQSAQIQPASLDLTLSEEAYSVPGSMLPLHGEAVRELARRFSRQAIDLSKPQVFVRGQVYVVRLRERVRLPESVAAYANNKSSTGRIDLQTRVLTDDNPRYDKIPTGYRGDLGSS